MALGGRTVAEWQAAMSSREFAEWAAYAQIEPFGPVRGDLRAGVVASVIAEVYRDPDKRREPFTPAEFMPMFEQDTGSGPGPGPGHATPGPDPAALFAKLKAGLGLNKDEKGRKGNKGNKDEKGEKEKRQDGSSE